jgi:hypothetical protein
VGYSYSFIDTSYYFVMVPMLYAAIVIFITGALLRLIKIGVAPNPKAITHRVFPEKRSKLLAILSDIFLFPGITRTWWVFYLVPPFSFFSFADSGARIGNYLSLKILSSS